MSAGNDREGSDAGSAASTAVDTRRATLEELVVAARERGRSPAFAHLDNEAVESEVRVGAARIAAATCAWLEAVGELVARDIWADQYFTSPATWLTWAVGMSASTAREHVRVALSLPSWPRLHERFRAGRISYSKVRAITRHGDPAIEDLLLQYSEHADGAQLERILASFGKVQDRADAPTPFEARQARVDVCDDGIGRLVLTGPIELVARLGRQLDRLAWAAWEDDRRAARVVAAEQGIDPVPPEPIAAYRCDVLAAAVDAIADELPDDSSGRDAHTLVLHVSSDALAEAEDLEAAHDDADARRERPVLVEADLGRRTRHLTMSPRTIHRLACEAGLVAALHDHDGAITHQTGRTSRVPPRMRRALQARDRHCRYPGCGTTRWLHAHHIRYASHGGPTRLDNLVLLCSRHHHAVHDHDVAILHDGRGHVRFVHPTVGTLPPARPLPGASPDDLDPACGNRASAEALEPTAYEVRYDLALCIDVLVHELARHQPPKQATMAA